jgi:hypothetical protein
MIGWLLLRYQYRPMGLPNTPRKGAGLQWVHISGPGAWSTGLVLLEVRQSPSDGDPCDFAV